MTGALAVKPSTATVQVTADASTATISSYVYWSKRRFISIPTEKASSGFNQLQYVDMDADGSGKSARYNILHTGNKPSGSYTGNGSAASRTIATGGIGHVVVVYASVSIAIITSSGAICCNLNTGEVVAHNKANFQNGVLTLTTAGDYVNFNSNTYNYQVL